jgi:hypothetical protein
MRMNTTERIAITQAWARRHAPPRELSFMLSEIDEMAHWSDDELTRWRHLLMDDYATALEMRSDLFPNLVSFEAWHRLTGYVLGQPMDAETTRRTAWLWDYNPDLYAPYNPWMVEEQAMLVTLTEATFTPFYRDWQAQYERLHSVDPDWRGEPMPEKAAFWQKLGTSPLFMRLVNSEDFWMRFASSPVWKV